MELAMEVFLIPAHPVVPHKGPLYSCVCFHFDSCFLSSVW